MADNKIFSGLEIERPNTIQDPNKIIRSSNISTSTLRYPLDIGAEDKGHYVLISAKKRSDKNPNVDPSNMPEIIKNWFRTARTIEDVIALYMPDTVAFSTTQTFDSASLNPLQRIMDIPSNITNRILGESNPNIIYSLFGVVKNPMIELLYTKPEFRTLNFQFLFYPRSEEESLQVQKIIHTLRYHQAPSIHSLTFGFFLVPPSEFDIQFKYKSKDNPNISKISNCILESLSVDYAPNGFSAYEGRSKEANLGGTGSPVAIRLDLNFKETEYITKDNLGISP